MSVEGRLTVANMSIEGGARAGLIAPDETTFAYLKGRPMAPKGEDWDKAVAWWRTLPTDAGARYDKTVLLHATDIAPSLTWGTSPEDVVPITGAVPDPESFADPSKRVAAQKSLDYMGLAAGHRDAGRSRSSMSSSAAAPTAGSRICAPPPRWRRAAMSPTASAGAGRARLGAGQAAGRGRGARPHLHRGRLRMARARLLDVPRDESR